MAALSAVGQAASSKAVKRPSLERVAVDKVLLELVKFVEVATEKQTSNPCSQLAPTPSVSSAHAPPSLDAARRQSAAQARQSNTRTTLTRHTIYL